MKNLKTTLSTLAGLALSLSLAQNAGAQTLCQITVTQKTNTLHFTTSVHKVKASTEGQCKRQASRWNVNPDPQNIASVEVSYTWKKNDPAPGDQTAQN